MSKIKCLIVEELDQVDGNGNRLVRVVSDRAGSDERPTVWVSPHDLRSRPTSAKRLPAKR
ncbi:hypothetical protein SAMN05892883_2088 [Jatrophihabitans sp. GAS493]|uniref:hypothetical protein n=1 Tax=Jatrophihabitans sp. GAS493 TaxID=1907575 RepID=UPI000BB8047A|nr:hypothetical protein [Jatrophihabitans sp. GAS493]SOD72741.1 hypothetical protein SAMN05892883_2088 [Jatrophihabitans sp. GAS493]